jgi:hypothetical protein
MELFEPLKLDDFDDHGDYVAKNYTDRDLSTVNIGKITQNLNRELVKIMGLEF